MLVDWVFVAHQQQIVVLVTIVNTVAAVAWDSMADVAGVEGVGSSHEVAATLGSAAGWGPSAGSEQRESRQRDVAASSSLLPESGWEMPEISPAHTPDRQDSLVVGSHCSAAL
jgi:hypothetical protein